MDTLVFGLKVWLVASITFGVLFVWVMYRHEKRKERDGDRQA